MEISFNPALQTQIFKPVFKNNPSVKDSTDKKEVSTPKIVLSALALAGITTLAIVKIKGKKSGGKKPDLKNLAGKTTKKVKDMTCEEKEKFIKDLQAKTNNPATKEEIRKLVESGEWDNLG